jgi:hypothetical protein
MGSEGVGNASVALIGGIYARTGATPLISKSLLRLPLNHFLRHEKK